MDRTNWSKLAGSIPSRPTSRANRYRSFEQKIDFSVDDKPLPLLPEKFGKSDLQILGTKFGPMAGSSTTGVLGDASHHGGTSRFRIDMPDYDMELKFVSYWNGRISFTGNGEIAGANPISAKSAWEPAGSGASIPLFAEDGVTRTVLMASGARQNFYPKNKIIVPGGSLPYCRSGVFVTGSQTFPVGRAAHQTVNSMGESCNYFSPNAGIDYTDAVGEFSTNTPTYFWGPSGIYGIPADRKRRRQIWILGDSRVTYSGTDGTSPFGDTNGYVGWIERKIKKQYATINSGRANSRLYWRVAGMLNELALCAPYVTDVIIDIDINDLNDGRTLAQVQGDYAVLIPAIQAYGVRVHLVTTTPNPATTANGWVDGGATLKAHEAVRAPLNAWKKTKPLGVASCIDVCAHVEDPNRPGFWRPDPVPLTPEGLHYSGHGMTKAGSALDLNAFS